MLELKSPAFGDGEPIPLRFAAQAAGGENLSPPYQWSGVPEGTRSLALAVVDRAPVARNWVHWLVVDIPVRSTGLAEGASGVSMPPGSRVLRGTVGDAAWWGPKAPAGTGAHPYEATLYALDVERLDLPSATTLDHFERAIAGHVLARASWTGTFER